MMTPAGTHHVPRVAAVSHTDMSASLAELPQSALSTSVVSVGIGRGGKFVEEGEK